MRRIFLNEKFKFFTKVTLAHFITYMVCGIIAFNLFNYGDFVENLGFRPMEEISMTMLVLGQIIRGILFGIVIWLIKDSLIGKKLGWLKLWVTLVILGIFNTYGPNTGSIEGMIYLDLAQFEYVPVSGLFSLLEITVQPLLFSIIVTYQRKKSNESSRDSLKRNP